MDAEREPMLDESKTRFRPSYRNSVLRAAITMSFVSFNDADKETFVSQNGEIALLSALFWMCTITWESTIIGYKDLTDPRWNVVDVLYLMSNAGSCASTVFATFFNLVARQIPAECFHEYMKRAGGISIRVTAFLWLWSLYCAIVGWVLMVLFTVMWPYHLLIIAVLPGLVLIFWGLGTLNVYVLYDIVGNYYAGI
eukprot:gnl/TRDRNA2_/TRDRNA2_76206_c1_seq1.p1 gnl/TRDRNA2_/TRDRNA2_76206_c1~~gnl/TRDRNA2_/TRDRNA2_76206_c1_seq1.p1  ORF type:complete len:203 (+),score=10.75 gnl/TRDRNA2_/TRDRNA2_76206_c1_seq1:23-610(+)